ncbi:DNA-directed RNA polymerases I and III subunit RPAC1-like protein [Basidiobolus meristosporus CBS 931.73]|uniref:DNA-directed RNA polymerases I and III subunit RPAC1 n=1 Tax=Basidiobolus meristosporus CBS 931.73 TaxID=1314790 RepID=A0A1Y1YN37_9FUNG|nr:DNA-directed RNA polymerases I and III subunit RPAC1-like protein [Basidiobolus meristosporus CBS 931.73]|eukprot:ORX98974.1 DNA-directed RNA polymerases I and III subunit RPAC1-like protein [Basidiobolus meristosporus CBS 931.73]
MDNTELLRSRVILEKDHVNNVSSSDFPGVHPGYDDSFQLETFKKNLKVKIWRVSPTEMEFDLVGVDASIANAFRRILISEVPTMAVEHVYFMNNTSVIQDEVLAHRLGLVPIKANPNSFEFKKANDSPTDLNTLVFKLHIKCEFDPQDDSKYINEKVYSNALVWDPKGDQAERFAEDPVRPVFDDILLAKLRPGQEIEAELHCEKGIGKDHAKYSPVSTASYRLLPEIIVQKDITGELADKFAACFPPGVVEIVEKKGVRKAVVVNPRKDTVSREVLRHAEFRDIVKLTRVRDHFIFNIESTGIMTPPELFIQSVQALLNKCKVVKQALANINQSK